eukprot:5610859-Prymnesium_polylepis.1
MGRWQRACSGARFGAHVAHHDRPNRRLKVDAGICQAIDEGVDCARTEVLRVLRVQAADASIVQ